MTVVIIPHDLHECFHVHNLTTPPLLIITNNNNRKRMSKYSVRITTEDLCTGIAVISKEGTIITLIGCKARDRINEREVGYIK